MDPQCPCTNVVLTVYAHVRTEPQCDIGQTRGKKKRILLEQCRYYWTDCLRGQGEPLGWDDRFDIDRDQWHEHLLLYERDLMIQEDMEWLYSRSCVHFLQKASRQVDQRE